MSYFSRKEMSCRCPCHIYNLSVDLMLKLSLVRECFGKSMIITSACRCPSHNERVGGSKTSSHLTTKAKKCLALDIKFPKSGVDLYDLIVILPLQFDRILINPYKKFIHLDIDKNKPRGLWFYRR